MQKPPSLSLSLLLFCCACATTPKTPSRQPVDRVLDDWHLAAAEAEIRQITPNVTRAEILAKGCGATVGGGPVRPYMLQAVAAAVVVIPAAGMEPPSLVPIHPHSPCSSCTVYVMYRRQWYNICTYPEGCGTCLDSSCSIPWGPIICTIAHPMQWCMICYLDINTAVQPGMPQACNMSSPTRILQPMIICHVAEGIWDAVSMESPCIYWPRQAP